MSGAADRSLLHRGHSLRRREARVRDEIRSEPHGGGNAGLAQRVDGDAPPEPVRFFNRSLQLVVADFILRRVRDRSAIHPVTHTFIRSAPRSTSWRTRWRNASAPLTPIPLKSHVPPAIPSPAPRRPRAVPRPDRRGWRCSARCFRRPARPESCTVVKPAASVARAFAEGSPAVSVDMDIDQPWQQGQGRKIDLRRVRGYRDISTTPCSDDPVTIDDDRGVVDESAILDIDHAARADDDRRVLWVPVRNDRQHQV